MYFTYHYSESWLNYQPKAEISLRPESHQSSVINEVKENTQERESNQNPSAVLQYLKFRVMTCSGLSIFTAEQSLSNWGTTKQSQFTNFKTPALILIYVLPFQFDWIMNWLHTSQPTFHSKTKSGMMVVCVMANFHCNHLGV